MIKEYFDKKCDTFSFCVSSTFMINLRHGKQS